MPNAPEKKKRLEAAYEMSTIDRILEFQEGLEALSRRIPLSAARAYLLLGIRAEGVDNSVLEEIDRLQSVRKEAIRTEMRWALIQLEYNFFQKDDGPKYDRDGRLVTTPEELLGADVVSGDSIRPGFSEELYRMAPSLEVYRHLMWYTPEELEAYLKHGEPISS